MWPNLFELDLSSRVIHEDLKGYMKNHHCPDDSIVKRYIPKEAIEFCSNYLSVANSIGIPRSHHDGRYKGKGTQGLNVKITVEDVLLQENLYILNIVAKVQTYLSTHKIIIKENLARMNEK